MKILLTGGSGFIGRHVLAQLERQGIEIVIAGRTRPPGFSGEHVAIDLLQPEAITVITERVRATHLLHIAWYAEHGKYWSSPLNLRWLEATVRLVEAFCAAGGQHVLVAGTCAEYDWASGYCREEDTPIVPSTLYGITKDATRRIVSAVCNANGVPWAWGRIFLPYGPGEDVRRLIPSLFDVFQGRRSPFGVNASAYRDFLHVEDVSRGFVHLLLANASGTYNVSSGEPTRIGDIVRLVADVCAADPRLVLELCTERPGEPHMLVGDNQKLKSLGWQPTQSLAQIGISR